jgi:hypothetical protein
LNDPQGAVEQTFQIDEKNRLETVRFLDTEYGGNAAAMFDLIDAQFEILVEILSTVPTDFNMHSVSSRWILAACKQQQLLSATMMRRGYSTTMVAAPLSQR